MSLKIGIKLAVKAEMKDIKKVDRAVARAKKRVHARQGAYLMGVARRSIKRRKKPSQPGQPIHSQTGGAKRAIRFAATPEGVIVGFAIGRNTGGQPMDLHEHGGTVRRRVKRRRV